ncbi:hypothetical protein BKA70DRAFT_1089116 [Coprinopsis sp. MPI-PUGE-AT-0042]|nr:hypothetical protein BKA70DRAFT_1089116 [Coprinopsis sp. MPI-PUGE-AT-0042]
MSDRSPPQAFLFWDESAFPNANMSGYEVVKAVRTFAANIGPIMSLRFYVDIGGNESLSPGLRSELQCSGVSIIDTVACGRQCAASKMLSTDLFVHAVNNVDITSVIIVISADPDLGYPISMLRMRGEHVMLVCPAKVDSQFLHSVDGTILEGNVLEAVIPTATPMQHSANPPLAMSPQSTPPHFQVMQCMNALEDAQEMEKAFDIAFYRHFAGRIDSKKVLMTSLPPSSSEPQASSGPSETSIVHAQSRSAGLDGNPPPQILVPALATHLANLEAPPPLRHSTWSTADLPWPIPTQFHPETLWLSPEYFTWHHLLAGEPIVAPTASAFPGVPTYFDALIYYLRARRSAGLFFVPREALYKSLLERQPDVFLQAGTARFKNPIHRYICEAETLGIVVKEGQYVSLHPKYY